MNRKPKKGRQAPRNEIARKQEAPPSEPEGGASLTFTSHFQATTYAEPWLPPELLATYDEMVPGAAEKILEQILRQSDHRMTLERTVVLGDSRRAYLGVAAGLIVSLAGFVATGYLAWLGHPWPGAVIGSIDIVGLVAAFIYGTNSRRDERETKAGTSRQKR